MELFDVCYRACFAPPFPGIPTLFCVDADRKLRASNVEIVCIGSFLLIGIVSISFFRYRYRSDY